MTPEAQIQADVAALREQISDTQQLYREVCVVLFFRHGIAPTANKLYQYVRKGSMSAPAEALAKFWDDLREKSRVRIEHPDLPDALKTAAGEMVAVLWGQAQSAAEEAVSSLRIDAKAAVQEAEARLQEANTLKDAAQRDLRQAIEERDTARAMVRGLEQSLAGESATRVSLELQLASARQDATDLQQAMADVRRDFGFELGKLREALNLTEERHQAAESRALIEIDRERTIAARLQKDLEMVRGAAIEAATSHRSEVRDRQNEIGDQKQRLGYLEGELRAVVHAKDELLTDLTRERALVRDLTIQLSEVTRESNAWQQKAVEVQTELDAMRAVKPRKRRKSTENGEDPATRPKRGTRQSS